MSDDVAHVASKECAWSCHNAQYMSHNAQGSHNALCKVHSALGNHGSQGNPESQCKYTSPNIGT
jgi:hypothetical protein